MNHFSKHHEWARDELLCWEVSNKLIGNRNFHQSWAPLTFWTYWKCQYSIKGAVNFANYEWAKLLIDRQRSVEHRSQFPSSQNLAMFLQFIENDKKLPKFFSRQPSPKRVQGKVCDRELSSADAYSKMSERCSLFDKPINAMNRMQCLECTISANSLMRFFFQSYAHFLVVQFSA